MTYMLTLYVDKMLGEKFNWNVYTSLMALQCYNAYFIFNLHTQKLSKSKQK